MKNPELHPGMAEEKGYPPSIREIGAQTQISSTSLVNYYLNQLEEMGYIERESNVSRGINLTQRQRRRADPKPQSWR